MNLSGITYELALGEEVQHSHQVAVNHTRRFNYRVDEKSHPVRIAADEPDILLSELDAYEWNPQTYAPKSDASIRVKTTNHPSLVRPHTLVA